MSRSNCVCILNEWEELEGRVLPATNIIVVNSDTDGVFRNAINGGTDGIDKLITIREALEGVNEASTGKLQFVNGLATTRYGVTVASFGNQNVIRFAIPGQGVHRITLDGKAGSLPEIPSDTVLDGYSQGKAVPNTASHTFNAKVMLEIDGRQLSAAKGVGFSFIEGASRSVIKGFSLFGFKEAAIDLSSVGSQGQLNGITYSSPVVISGNVIGLDAAGGTSVPKNGYGILSMANPITQADPEAVIGGYTVADRNIISNSTFDGILIEGIPQVAQDPAAIQKRVTICGNFIGIGFEGNPAQNGGNGVHVMNSDNVTVGGSISPGAPPAWDPTLPLQLPIDETRAPGNVISSNAGIGIEVDGVGGEQNVNSKVTNRPGNGLYIRITGNRIGTSPDGQSIRQNGSDGVRLVDTAGVKVGGEAWQRNLISGNAGNGVSIFRPEEPVINGMYQNLISNNYIGTDSTGLNSRPNNLNGVKISGPSGGDIIKTNLISGNREDGIALVPRAIGIAPSLLGPFRTSIENNTIGLDANFQQAIANGANGIRLGRNSSQTFIAKNIIGGNDGFGVSIIKGSDITLRGNLIGVGFSSVINQWIPLPIGNRLGGLYIVSTPNIRVHNDPSGGDSVVAFNGGNGITIIGPDSTNVKVTDTLIANNENNGVLIKGASFTDFSTASGGPNVFSENGKDGVAISSGTNNQFLGSTFVNNTGLAIDLGNDGPTTNDPLDVDDGANRLQNKPVIASVMGDPNSPGSLQTTGSLSAASGTPYRIGLYANAIGVSGGQTYLGYVDVVTDSNGDATFTFSSPSSISVASITAIAVALNGAEAGDTSEFSTPVGVGSTSISGLVWQDLNRDGIRQTGQSKEPILTGVEVDLYDGGGTKLGSTLTLAGGKYGFIGLAPGQYTVKVVSDFKLTQPGQGANPNLNSDFDQISKSAFVDLTTVLTADHIDAGLLLNSIPVGVNDSYSTPRDQTLTIPASGVLANDSDPDFDPLTAVLASGPSHGTLSFSPDGSFIYNPNLGYIGTDSFTYTPADGFGSGAAVTATIQVTGVPNNLPLADNDSAYTLQNTAVDVNVLANDSDVDGDVLLVTSVPTSGSNAPVHGTVLITGGGTGLTYIPTPGFVGSDSFQYTISDGRGGTASAIVNVTVDPVNHFPVAGDDSTSTPQNIPVDIAVLVNDTDLDSDTITISSFTQGMKGGVAFSPGGPGLTYTPNTNFVGTDTFAYTISDGRGGTATATVTVTVNAVNSPPAAVNDSYSVVGNQTLTVPAPGVLANDTDEDGDTLTASLAGGPANGTLVLNPDGSFTYTPAAGFVGADSFVYSISDGHGGTATATVNLTVTSPLGSIGDFVWIDTNWDGLQSPGESGFGGVTVQLTGGTGTFTQVTDSTGHYQFSNLVPGNYQVQFIVPVGYSLTQTKVGIDDSIDSDALPSGFTNTISLAAGETNSNIDAGFYQSGSGSGSGSGVG